MRSHFMDAVIKPLLYLFFWSFFVCFNKYALRLFTKTTRQCWAFAHKHCTFNCFVESYGLGRGRGSPFFENKIILKSRSTHFQIKGIFDGIRIFVWQTSPTHPNLWLVRFDPISSVANPEFQGKILLFLLFSVLCSVIFKSVLKSIYLALFRQLDLEKKEHTNTAVQFAWKLLYFGP